VVGRRLYIYQITTLDIPIATVSTEVHFEGIWHFQLLLYIQSEYMATGACIFLPAARELVVNASLPNDAIQDRSCLT
jgi:hypothetical protein